MLNCLAGHGPLEDARDPSGLDEARDEDEDEHQGRIDDERHAIQLIGVGQSYKVDDCHGAQQKDSVKEGRVCAPMDHDRAQSYYASEEQHVCATEEVRKEDRYDETPIEHSVHASLPEAFEGLPRVPPSCSSLNHAL